MMAKRKNNQLYIGLGIVAALVVLFLAFSQSFSVLSVSEIQLGADGKPQWVFFIRPSGEGESIEFISPSPEKMGEYDDNKGGTYVPQQSFKIYMEPEQIECRYDLTENKDLLDGLSDWLVFWKEDSEYYAVSESFERVAPIHVKTSKSTETKIIDGFDIGKTLTFSDQRDGDGKIIIQTQGGLIGNQDCVDTGGDLAVTLGKDTGTLKFWFDKDPRDSYYSRYERPEWSRDFECSVTDDKNQMICKRGITDIGSGTLTVTADAEYLDYRYYPPTQGEPKIVSINSQVEIQQNTYGSVMVTVKNIGDNSGIFTLEGTGGLNIVPSSTTVSLKAGEQKQVSFSMIAPQVSTETNKEGSFNMCSTGQFSSSDCDSKSFSVSVSTEKPKTDYCGDKICQLNEDYTNCPSDCYNVPTCNGNYMEIDNGICKCEDGYKMVVDKFGREYCTQKLSPILLIAGIFLVIILLMVLVRMKMKGGRK